MRKLMHPTSVISIIFLSLTLGGCFWHPPELSLAEAEGGEAESEFEAGAEAEIEGEGEGGEAESEFEASAEAEGEGGEAESAPRIEAETVAASSTSLTGRYTLEFSKTTGPSECAQFGEILDLKVTPEGLMTGYLYYSGSRGGSFSGRVRSNGTWSAIGPDGGYKFEGDISDEEVSGEYTAPAPVSSEGETSCEGTLEGFKLPD